MAEGGYNFGYDDPDIDPYPDDGDYDLTQLNSTQSSRPGQASTPYGGEIEMQTRQQEQSGLPETSYQETSFGGGERAPLIGGLKENSSTGILDISKGVPDINEDFLTEEWKNEQKERAWRFLRSRYPDLSEKDLVIGFSKKNPLILVAKGPRGGETPIFLKDGSDFQRSFLNQTYVKKALGRLAQSIIGQADQGGWRSHFTPGSGVESRGTSVVRLLSFTGPGRCLPLGKVPHVPF